MRNDVLVDNYDGVNLKLVWEIITEDLPELRDTLTGIEFPSGT